MYEPGAFLWNHESPHKRFIQLAISTRKRCDRRDDGLLESLSKHHPERMEDIRLPGIVALARMHSALQRVGLSTVLRVLILVSAVGTAGSIRSLLRNRTLRFRQA